MLRSDYRRLSRSHSIDCSLLVLAVILSKVVGLVQQGPLYQLSISCSRVSVACGAATEMDKTRRQ